MSCFDTERIPSELLEFLETNDSNPSTAKNTEASTSSLNTLDQDASHLILPSPTATPNSPPRTSTSTELHSSTSPHKRERNEIQPTLDRLLLKRFRPITQLALQKIISGGQTGADRAALEAALEFGFNTGGWAPPNFATCNGRDPLLGTKFHLSEIPFEGARLHVAYVIRSRKNVDDSDATVAFRFRPGNGTDKTIGYCITKSWKIAPLPEPPLPIVSRHRPVLIIADSVHSSLGLTHLSNPPPSWIVDAQRLKNFILEFNVKTLNICGHRQDASDPGWQLRVTNFLRFFFTSFKNS